MTDNKTSNNADNHGFGLNHFDQADEADSSKADTLTETASFYSDDLFTESAQAAAEHADPFAQPGYEKKEPIIPQAAEPEPQQSAADIDMAQPASAAPVPDSPLSEAPGRQRSGTKPITIFAVLAMLIAALAVWLNPGASQNRDEPTALQAQPVLTADIQIQRLDTRLAALEQRSSQQNEALNRQVAQLQQQLSALNSQLAKQANKQANKQPSVRPAATTRKTPAHRPATARPVSRQQTGWVVNLASVESKRAASKSLSRYKARGIPAEIHAATVKGQTWYRLRIGGFASKQEAAAQKRYLAQKFGIKDAWIQKP